MPPGHPLLGGGPSLAARWFGSVHARWLRRMGVSQANCYEGPVVEHGSCFAGRVAGEVLIGERKITGISQAWQRNSVLLTSGTLLSAVPWALLSDALGHRSMGEKQLLNATTIDAEQCLGPLQPQEWAAHLFDVLTDAVTMTNAFGPIESVITCDHEISTTG